MILDWLGIISTSIGQLSNAYDTLNKSVTAIELLAIELSQANKAVDQLVNTMQENGKNYDHYNQLKQVVKEIKENIDKQMSEVKIDSVIVYIDHLINNDFTKETGNNH